jgi:hypothetical protein
LTRKLHDAQHVRPLNSIFIAAVPVQPVDATPSNPLIRQCFPGEK